MRSYEELFYEIVHDGTVKESRQGVKTISLHGAMLTHDFKDGFPLLTSKKINFKHIVVETLWYLKGTDKITFLKENGVHIWDNWADENDSIGPTYGVQWRDFNTEVWEQLDQVKNTIELLKSNPNTRRAVINGWNPLQLNKMKLPPCITQLQFLVNDGKLDLIVTQRSADFAIGVPYDIAEMALLQLMIATITGYTLGKLKFMYGDIHIYEDHLEKLKEQMTRLQYDLPYVEVDKYYEFTHLEDFDIGDFILENYKHGNFIKYKVHV